MSDLNLVKNECEKRLRFFKSLLRRHDPSGMDPVVVQEFYMKWDEELSNALNSIEESVSNMIIDHKAAMSTDAINQWEQHVSESEKKYRDHTAATFEVVKSVRAQAVPTPISASANETLNAIKAAEVENVIEAERVADQGKELENEITKYDDWGNATNEEIEEAMRDIEEWRKLLSKIEDRVYLMKKNVKLFDLSSVKLTESVDMMENLKEQMNIAIHVIKEQDNERGLYSLSKSKAADVKLPRFGGKPHENFAKFKTEMLRGFKSNKVRREDQVKKLRENLFDQPKTMVPPSMESIADAWKILNDMYGDSARVMNAKVLELRRLKENPDGGYPRRGGGINLLKAQIEWITRLEVTLNGIMELGEESNQLDRDAFGSRTIVSVLDLFPFQMQDELEREMGPAKEDGKEKLFFIIKYLKDLRKKRQGMQKTQELVCGSKSRGNSWGKYGSSDEDSTDENDVKKTIHKDKYRLGAQVAAKPNKNCKVCKYLESHPERLRGSKTLFAQHYGMGPGGCPRFMELDISLRREVVKEMQICNKCLVNKYPVPPGEDHAGCRVTTDTKEGDDDNGKIRFHACNEEECLESFLLCDSPVHMTKNQVKLIKWKEKWKERDVQFSVNLVRVGTNLSQNKIDVFETNKKDEEFDVFKTNKNDEECDVFKTNKNDEECDVFETNTNDEAENDSIKLKKATEKLKKAAEGSNVVEVPEGSPLFLFSSAVGKTRPINVFYDKGCSHVVFRDGVPQHELVSVMTKKGPLAITGVGDTKVKVKDEWTCLLDRADDCKQVVQGVTVDHITAPYPLINISEAVEEVKAADPENKELQDLRVPSVAGGEADVLFGILYESCHPVHIHTLPSGLFLAKLKLASPDDQWTGVIGGPHKSFEVLSQQAGDVTRLIAHFVEGIKNFKATRAPDLQRLTTTWDDAKFATKMNKLKVENCVNQEMEFLEDKFDKRREKFQFKEDVKKIFDDNKNIHCGDRGTVIEKAAVISELSRSLEEVSVEGKANESHDIVLFFDTLDNDEETKKNDADLKLQSEEKETFEQEMLVQGRWIFETPRLERMKTRAELSKYKVSALKMLNFRNVKRIKFTSNIFEFLRRIGLVKKSEIKFRMFSVIDEGSREVEKLRWFEDEDISMVVQFWYISGHKEISRFIKKEFTEKSAMTEIRFGKNRIKDGQMFLITGGFNEESLDSKVQLDVIKMTLKMDRSLTASVTSFITNKEECIELNPGDIYPFLKIESDMYSGWTVGHVHSVTRSKDGVIRRMFVKNINHHENKLSFKGRTHAMAEVKKLMTNRRKEEVPRKVEPAKLTRKETEEDRHNDSVHADGGILGNVCLDNKRIKDIVSLPINYCKSSLLHGKLRSFYTGMFEAFNTIFNLYEEVVCCVNRMWLLVYEKVLQDEDNSASVSTT